LKSSRVGRQEGAFPPDTNKGDFKMARSYKKTPIVPNASADSDKAFKRAEARKSRAKGRRALRNGDWDT